MSGMHRRTAPADVEEIADETESTGGEVHHERPGPLIHYMPGEWTPCGADAIPGVDVLGTDKPDLVTCADCLPFLPVSEYQQHRDRQRRIAISYLIDHLTHPAAVARAAVILRAEPWASRAEQGAGLVLAVGAEGSKVKCAGCGKRYDCLPEDPWYSDPADETGKTGLCLVCLITETRSPVLVDAITPTAIHPPQRKRRAKPAATEIDHDQASTPSRTPDTP